ncbi:MAG: hypothetical protein L0H79_17530 [Intrasporangium sp.]|uniref:COG1470 family protein n=1 Tax=Intrasporangium sp. TaxID=1925024 RepID=UPI002649C0E3|nr:hypothetical protein [Intrasporangium sp.]MDN5797531.1 hypothetical protein [Intrasporangium sp.]
MSTVARLDQESVSLNAGDSATIPLEVRNTGDVVEDYQLEVVGVPAEWTTIADPEFTLYPGTSTVTTLTVSPPRSCEVPAGRLSFGIRVVPLENPDDTVVPEAVVEVLPFLDTTAELVPRTSRGRRGGRHQVAIDNRGNVPVTAFIAVTDQAEQLKESDTEGITVAPGRAMFTKIKVRPVELHWTGPPTTIPFVVTVTPQDSLPVALQGTHLQEPVIPKWFGKALLIALATLLALAAIWAWLLKPAVQAAARDEAADVARQEAQAQAKQVAAQAAEAQKAATAAQVAQVKAAAAAQKADTSNKQVQVAVTGGVPPRVVTAPFSLRLAVTDARAGTSGTDAFTIPKGQSLSITDFVLENPQGDEGLLRVSIGSKIILEQALESFRTTDYHFVTPFVAAGESKVTLTVQCRLPGAPPGVTPAPTTCRDAVTIGGPRSQPAPKPTKKP